MSAPTRRLDSTKAIGSGAGTVWAYIQNWAARGITLVVFFVLARLLSPSDFGGFALAIAFLTLGEIFVEQIFSHVIVQRETLTEAHLDSAFWITMLFGVALAGASIAAAPFFASAFGSPESGPLIMALSPVFGCMALSSVPAALLRRSLDYQTLARRTALSNLLSGAVAIGAALVGWGVWAFVLQQLVFQFVGTVVLWRHESWRPRRYFSFLALKDLIGFSSRITAVKILDLVETRVLELIIARNIGIVPLGNYALAARAQQAAIQLLAAPLWESSISVFSRKQGEREALIASLRDRAMLVAMLIIPCFLLTAASAKALIPAVFGHQWKDAIEPFQILCLVAAVRGLAFLYGALLQAMGAAEATLKISILRTVLALGSLPFLVKFGPNGVAASLLIGVLVSMPVVLRLMSGELGIPWVELVRYLVVPVAACFVAASLSLLMVNLVAGHLPDFFNAILSIGSGGILFGILALVLMPRELMVYYQQLPESVRLRFPLLQRALTASCGLGK
jgi:O-antigen/teichoic acid export membrane protein